jgi:putative ABC transport system substrate-binding protein
MPASYEYDIPFVRDGGLTSYAPDLKESMERAADLASPIFKGAKAGRPAVRGADGAIRWSLT